MKSYYIRRVFYFIPTLLGVITTLFLIFYVIGGDPAFQLAGKNATSDQIQSLRQELGTDQSLIKQYKNFLFDSLTFNWGQSWSMKEDISSIIFRGLGPTLALTLPAFLMSFLIAISLALLSSISKSLHKKNYLVFFCLSTMSISFLSYIIIFQYFLAFKLGLFPISGWSEEFPQMISYLLLPWLISIIVSLGPDTLLYRNLVSQEIQKDYVKTARAKGLLTNAILFKHVLKNSILPILALLLSRIPQLLLGSLLIESFFAIPGLGGLLVFALQNSDFPVIKAITITISIFYIILNLISDLSFKYFDPRLELE